MTRRNWEEKKKREKTKGINQQVLILFKFQLVKIQMEKKRKATSVTV